MLLQIVVSEYNLSVLQEETLILTADSPSYISPARNVLENGIWKDSFDGASAYVQRPPLYGSIYLICSLIADDPASLLKWIQYGFMGLGIYCWGLLIFSLTGKKRATYIASIAFGVLPFFHGFVGYLMTEALSPYLLIILLYAFISYYREGKNLWVLLLMSALLPIFRVQLIVFPLVFLVFIIWKRGFNKSWLLLTFIPFFVWQLNVYEKMGSFQLHPIYSYSNQTIYRPPHREVSNLFRIWEHKSEHLHKAVSLLRNDSSTNGLNKSLALVPDEYRADVKPILKEYQLLIHKNLSPKKQEELERSFVERLDKRTNEIAADHKVQNCIKTPFHSALDLVASSHLNLFIFQKKHRGNGFVEGLRIISISLIILSFVATLFAIFSSKRFSLIAILIAFWMSFFYLIFVQRMNETRYLVPYLPIIFLFLVLTLKRLQEYRSRI